MSRTRLYCNSANPLVIRSFLFVLVAIVAAPAAAGDSPVVTVKVEAEFADILDNVKSTIAGRGINIAHVLPASEMLNRTGESFGIKENVFIEAQTVEFCSARISHHLAKADPQNILLCPFTISVYVLTSDPEHVRVSYRRPYTIDPGSEPAVREMVELVDGIVEEAVAW
jgi:uncharacterized protein (DUF302 family)